MNVCICAYRGNSPSPSGNCANIGLVFRLTSINLNKRKKLLFNDTMHSANKSILHSHIATRVFILPL